MRKLGDVAAVFDGPHATPRTVDSGPIFLGISALQDGVINLGETRHVTEADFERWTRRVRPATDDIVFSYETRLGQAAIIPEGLECCLGRRMGLVRFRDKAVNPRFFLYQYLSPSFRAFLDSKTIHGATVDRLSIKDVPTFPIALPPLPEQRRIVGILDEAFEGIATAKANAATNLLNARALFDSHLNAIFTQRGKGWVDVTLGPEIDLLAGFAFKSAKYTNRADDIRLLRGDNIMQGTLRWDDVKRWPRSEASGHERYLLREGDIVLAMDRPWVKDGLKRATLSASDVPSLLVQRTARLRCGPRLDPGFLVLLLGSPAFARHVLGVQTGIGVPHISGQQIQAFMFPRPPLAEQRRIAEHLELLHANTLHLAALYQRKLAALAALKKSLLHQAFSGQL